MAFYKQYVKLEIVRDGVPTGEYIRGRLLKFGDFDNIEDCEAGVGEYLYKPDGTYICKDGSVYVALAKTKDGEFVEPREYTTGDFLKVCEGGCGNMEQSSRESSVGQQNMFYGNIDVVTSTKNCGYTWEKTVEGVNQYPVVYNSHGLTASRDYSYWDFTDGNEWYIMYNASGGASMDFNSTYNSFSPKASLSSWVDEDESYILLASDSKFIVFSPTRGNSITPEVFEFPFNQSIYDKITDKRVLNFHFDSYKKTIEFIHCEEGDSYCNKYVYEQDGSLSSTLIYLQGINSKNILAFARGKKYWSVLTYRNVVYWSATSAGNPTAVRISDLNGSFTEIGEDILGKQVLFNAKHDFFQFHHGEYGIDMQGKAVDITGLVPTNVIPLDTYRDLTSKDGEDFTYCYGTEIHSVEYETSAAYYDLGNKVFPKSYYADWFGYLWLGIYDYNGTKYGQCRVMKNKDDIIAIGASDMQWRDFQKFNGGYGIHPYIDSFYIYGRYYNNFYVYRIYR